MEIWGLNTWAEYGSAYSDISASQLHLQCKDWFIPNIVVKDHIWSELYITHKR